MASNGFAARVFSKCGGTGARMTSPRVLVRILVGSGGHLHGLVETPAVDARNFRTHGPKVGSKLSSMMDAMVRDKREIRSRRQFEHSKCGNNLCQLVW